MKSIRELMTLFKTEYISDGIDITDMAANPVNQFEKWIEDAVKNKLSIPNAMHLTTVGSDGRPSGRIMLLRGFDERGFIFFTNYDSRKGNELRENNYASMTFLWRELYRQVRIEGCVSRISGEESDKYFRIRPRENQISAIASSQSKVLESRGKLEEKVKELEQKYKGQVVPRPDNWGGFNLSPDCFEFWLGRSLRLHDRIQYKLDIINSWKIQRLYP
jgi:pyridoxamine 5'-phosphate oxidase